MARLHGLKGRVALITGAGRGIGRATAAALIQRGMHVAIAEVDEAAGRAAAESLGSRGRKARYYALDVRNADQFREVVAQVERDLGTIDVLVNNAGIMPVGPFLDLSTELDQRQIEINVGGVIAGMRAVLPGMLERKRGHIINIASVAGRVAAPGIAVYAATKHAVIGLTEAVRHEHEPNGVQFSYVCPSLVKTELTAGTTPLRFPPAAEPEDVAKAVVRALDTGKVDLYVPRVARIGYVLPAVLPRKVAERIGRLLGAYRVFGEVDAKARQVYAARIGEG